MGKLFVLGLCLLQIKRSDGEIRLIVLTVVVSTVRSWTLVAVHFGADMAVLLATSVGGSGSARTSVWRSRPSS